MVINVAMALGVFSSASILLPFDSYGGASMLTSMLNALDISYAAMRRYLFQDDPVILNPSVWEDRTVILNYGKDPPDKKTSHLQSSLSPASTQSKAFPTTSPG
jgi:hypothetical protein